MNLTDTANTTINQTFVPISTEVAEVFVPPVTVPSIPDAPVPPPVFIPPQNPVVVTLPPPRIRGGGPPRQPV